MKEEDGGEMKEEDGGEMKEEDGRRNEGGRWEEK